MNNTLRTYEGYVNARLLEVDVADTSDLALPVDDAKSYARIDTAVEDDIVQWLIEAGQEEFEKFTQKLLFQREVEAVYQPQDYKTKLQLPWLPLVSVTSVKNEDDEDIDYEIVGDWLQVDTIDIVTVTYDGGLYTQQSDVNSGIKIGLAKWITSNYNDREDVALESVSKMPNGSKKHWMKYKELYV